jgi:hypothetical protein
MVGAIENFSQFEVRAVIRFLQAEVLNQNEIHRRLVECLWWNAFCRKEEYVWCNKFKNDRKEPNTDLEKHRDRS